MDEVQKKSIQNSFDALNPWISLFKIDGQDYGGQVDFSTDTRIDLFHKYFPDVKNNLELGSLEGAHTIALAKFPGVQNVLGLEVRDHNIMKANLVKDIYKVNNINFKESNLETQDLSLFGKFDAVFCVGVLYHLPNPWFLLNQISKVSDKLFIWTHICHDEQANQEINGYFGYNFVESGWEDPLSGASDNSFWPSRESLIKMLRVNGFTEVLYEEIDFNHPHGPGIILAIQKK